MSLTASIDHRQVEAVLLPMLDSGVAVVCSSVAGDPEMLAPIERDAVSSAILRRKMEFAAGRSAAREAMRRLGLPGLPVPAGQDRSPVWPTELVGSISHCRTTCIAVVALSRRWGSVGVDVEDDSGIPSELWPTICRPEELRRAHDLPEAARARWVTRVFSAKEAYYKWSYPRTRTMLDFQDVLIDFPSTLDSAQFRAKLVSQQAAEEASHELSGASTSTQGLVVSLMLH